MIRKIYNQKRFKQPLLFEGLESGKVSYTDVDFIREIDNKYLIIGEVKTRGTVVPIGQRLLIERLCDKNWKEAVAVIVEHTVPVEEGIQLKDTLVREYRFANKEWTVIKTDEQKTFLEFTEILRKVINTKKI